MDAVTDLDAVLFVESKFAFEKNKLGFLPLKSSCKLLRDSSSKDFVCHSRYLL